MARCPSGPFESFNRSCTVSRSLSLQFGFACAAALLALAGPSAAQTITVTTTEDVVDFGNPQTAAQLPGADGKVSFREALTAANNMPGPQTIAFAIPQSEWWLVQGQALLKQELGIFALDDDATTLDFTTQTGFTGDTNPNGHEVGIYGLEPNAWGVASIYVFGDGCVIKGLDRVLQRGYALQIQGDDNRVIGCTISGPLHAAVYITGGFGGPTPTGNIVGGTAPGEGNVLSAGNDGVRIDAPADDNVVIGNVLTGSFNGVAVRGSEFTTTANDNRIGGPTPAERNVIADAGHYGEEGFPVGAQVSIEWATGTIIEGNYIGTTADGLASAVQRGPAGIVLRSNASGTVIRDNLISGIVVVGANHYAGQVFGVGIDLRGVGNGTVIEGNLIGTDVTGQAPIPNHSGIRETFFPGSPPSTSTRIGGTAPGQGNTIAFNDLDGVELSSAITGARISGNSIHTNGLLGIDLIPNGVTPNDPGDGDAGPNGLQNFPVLLSAGSTGGGTTVTGTLNSLPNQTFSVELFADAVCDPSGFGEGRTFLGALTVATNGAGNAAFAGTVPGAAGAGAFVTATATQVATGNTSEFSACVSAGPWAELGFAQAGSAGLPHLAGSGPLTTGSGNQLALTDAAPSAPAVLVFGFTALMAPFKGGTMVPKPDLLLPLPTNAAGGASLPFTWPAGAPAGITLHFQAWILDAAAVNGFAASNGIAGVSS
jgi:hypothetical protein